MLAVLARCHCMPNDPTATFAKRQRDRRSMDIATTASIARWRCPYKEETSHMSARFIMIIDDSPTICKILEVTLSRQGHQVMSFQQPVLALHALFQTKEVPFPDLLFVDLILPRMNGFQVIQFMRDHAQSRHIPIIVISRRDGLMDRLKARIVGANEYVTKPFKIQDIVKLVQRYT